MREVTLTERVLKTPVQVPLQLLMKSVPSLRTSLIQVVSKTTQYDHVAQRAERESETDDSRSAPDVKDAVIPIRINDQYMKAVVDGGKLFIAKEGLNILSKDVWISLGQPALWPAN